MSQDLPTTRELRYFVTLAQTGQYRRAAEKLGISQPSLSQQIAALESVLGLRLVERGRRGTQLTPAGRSVKERAAQVLLDLEELMEETRALAGGGGGRLHLGSTATIGPYFLPRFLRHLHAAHPDLRLVSRDGAPRDLVQELLTGVHDLVLLHLPVTSGDLVTQPLYREPLLLAVAHDHPLARLSEVSRADLSGHDMLSLNPAYALHDEVARLCREVGAQLRTEYEGTSLDALRQMVAMNMGVTLLPALYVRSEVPDPDGDLRLIPIKGGLYRTVGLAWRKSTGKPQLLRNVARAAAEVVRSDYAGRVLPAG